MFACLWQNPCLVYLLRLKGFNFKSILLTQSPSRAPFHPLSLYWESFFFLSHTSLMPGKVRALPVSPPGQRGTSHMPCRLARSSEPLYWMITTQTKKTKPQPALLQFLISYHLCENGTHKPLSLHMSSSLHPHTLLLSLLTAKHSLEIKVLLF